MTWICQHFDCNSQVIRDYDVLKYHEDGIKKLKKKHPNREDFAQALRSEFMYRYWSKCEWELIIERTKDGRIFLNPWVGCREPEKARIDVTDRTDFDWKGFAEFIVRDREKIDVFDQILYKWNEFVDYCWNYHHKWQRRKNDE